MNQDEYLDWWTKENEKRQQQFVTLDGLSVVVYKDVFCPSAEMTHAPTMMIRLMPADLSGKRVLDLGTGTGVLAICAARKGAAQVVATDIDQRALENARENVQRQGLDKVIDVHESNVFEHVSGTFDVILANLPIWRSFWQDTAGPVTSVYERFLAGLESHLAAPHGITLLTYASFGEPSILESLICPSPLLRKQTTERKSGVDWSVFHLERESAAR
jgi:16S rRNA G1207 methylase RsmC